MHDLLLILLLSGHLMLANVAAGGPLVCIWLEWKARGNRDTIAALAADYLARWSLLALIGAAVAGLLLGTLLWSDAYRWLWLERLTHKATWAIGEWGVSLAVATGYWLWRVLRPSAGGLAAAARIFLLLFSATNLLYHFPPLFLVASRLSDIGAASGPPLTPAMFRQEMSHGEIPALATHFTFASLAMAGIMLLGLALRCKRRGGSDEDYARIARWGGWIGLVPSLLQLAVGLWVLSSISGTMQSRLTGGHLVASACFLAGLAGALWLMRELAAIALGERERNQLIRAMALMVAVVVLMVAGQQLARPRKTSAAKSAAASSRSTLVTVPLH